MNEVLLRNAYSLHQAGNLNEAAQLYGEILRQDPNQVDALCMLGLLHGQRGELTEAQRLADTAAQIESKSARAHYHVGLLLQNLGRFDESAARYAKAIAIQPTHVTAHVGCGMVLAALGRDAEALASFDRALKLESNQPGGRFHRGGALMRAGRLHDALVDFDRYLALRPNDADGWNARASVLLALDRGEAALADFDRALALKPDLTGALVNKGTLLLHKGRYEEGIASVEKALAINPDIPNLRGNLILNRLHWYDWRGLDADRARVTADVNAGHRTATPFVTITISESTADQLQCARLWTLSEAPAATEPLWRGEVYRHDRIRIAYLSADFRSHATAYLMAGLFEHHDRQRFETIALSYGPDDGSPMRRRLEKSFDRFIDVREKNDREIAALLRQWEADIAVDLKGHTDGSRPGILSFRPAPVQAHYLGYPGTMGASYIDYLIADRIVIPEGQETHYSEHIVYLPDSYQPNDPTRPIGESPERATAGLPPEGFVFCSFNASYKVMPQLFDIWMRILKRVENSVLWLSEPLIFGRKDGLAVVDSNPGAIGNLRREAENRGLDSNRLIFAPFIESQEQHLARLRLADLFLDTLPVNAHTSASDALLAGVPILTMPGATFAGRVAASLLSAVGLPELIAPSLNDYESRAIALAEDPARLAALKAKLAANRKTHPLFDTARSTRHLEMAYREMWMRQQRGEKPASFSIVAAGAA